MIFRELKEKRQKLSNELSNIYVSLIMGMYMSVIILYTIIFLDLGFWVYVLMGFVSILYLYFNYSILKAFQNNIAVLDEFILYYMHHKVKKK